MATEKSATHHLPLSTVETDCMRRLAALDEGYELFVRLHDERGDENEYVLLCDEDLADTGTGNEGLVEMTEQCEQLHREAQTADTAAAPAPTEREHSVPTALREISNRPEFQERMAHRQHEIAKQSKNNPRGLPSLQRVDISDDGSLESRFRIAIKTAQLSAQREPRSTEGVVEKLGELGFRVERHVEWVDPIASGQFRLSIDVDEVGLREFMGVQRMLRYLIEASA